ncbi:Bifunctional uridylyltransferase/uridylyl-removing enzyme [Stutzerimonas stutzeri]
MASSITGDNVVNAFRTAHIALVAVGGYGRGELHPYSDIDLLILLDDSDHEIFRESIEGFLTLLWDIGLEVGQSVRSIAECAEEARADLTVITNLMESRTIAGPEHLRKKMLEVTRPDVMWPSKDFFLAEPAQPSTMPASSLRAASSRSTPTSCWTPTARRSATIASGSRKFARV